MVQHHFHVADFVVFALTIVISVGIGIYYAFSGGRQKTTSEYLVGGRTMNFIPVAISLMASFESSIMMLGFPAETYVYGIQNIMNSLGFFVTQLLFIEFIVPLIHPLKITSAYEYLELRFQSRSVRLLGTLMGVLTYTWYMGVVLFGPAVALEAVTGFSLWSSIFVISFVSVVYTAIGGLKAVIWTDVFQAVVMLTGIFAILIKGTIDSGGPQAVWDKAYDGGRLNFFNFDPDPRTRHTFWNLFVGSIIRSFGLGFNQSTIQRISSTKTQAEAKRMLLIVAPCFLITLCLANYEGIVAYAYYQTKGCDPFESKQLSDPNQIIPLIVMDIFTYLPGMPGLFLASLFSASLSTLSSGLSSLSALLWADIVHPIVGPRVSESKATLIAKVSVCIFGVLACGVAILVSQVGGTLTQIAGSLISAFSGPLTGLFFIACFFPRIKAKGAFFGGVMGLTFSTWLSIGITFSKSVKKTPWLPPASTENCPVDGAILNTTDLADVYGAVNVTGFTEVTSTVIWNITSAAIREPEGIEKLYTLSYNWISIIGTLTTIVMGLLFSLVTGMNKPGDVDPRYLASMTDTVFIFIPVCIRRRIRCIGPQYIKDEYKARFPDPTKTQTMLQTATEFKLIVANGDENLETEFTKQTDELLRKS
ncbi:sodium-coupled monocarboxylate transporter 1 [Biomphalaria pfeifferi]|uniref:Sodium-coupled monocarboxylate transporter 1 n=1 Tax=Biomphalaria pfeifferi TaxID=112525 RepID=A0AAD8BUV1_BIOPF|nr:sodium-coupled monocarboxylate transporter 1 [Biomphalaria pfeifferi]